MKRLICFFKGHLSYGLNERCVRCKAKFGVPKMRNPPLPPPLKGLKFSERHFTDKAIRFYARWLNDVETIGASEERLKEIHSELIVLYSAQTKINHNLI